MPMPAAWAVVKSEAARAPSPLTKLMASVLVGVAPDWTHWPVPCSAISSRPSLVTLVPCRTFSIASTLATLSGPDMSTPAI